MHFVVVTYLHVLTLWLRCEGQSDLKPAKLSEEVTNMTWNRGKADVLGITGIYDLGSNSN